MKMWESPSPCATLGTAKAHGDRTSYRLHLLHRLGLHLAGPPGDHVHTSRGRRPRAVHGEHGCEDPALLGCPPSAAAAPQLVSRGQGLPRRAPEPLRVLAAGVALSLLADRAVDQSDGASPRASPVDARDGLRTADRVDVPAHANGPRSHPRAGPGADD